MKKKTTSRICEVVCCCFISILFVEIQAQNKVVLSGKIVKATSNTPLENVLVSVKTNPNIFTYSNQKGYFSFEVPVNAMLHFYTEGYVTQDFSLSNISNEEFYLGTIALYEKNKQEIYANTLVLSDDEIVDNDIGGANAITGLLQSSKDVFIRTAAFNFGQARFKIRGYDSREGAVLFNSIRMNKIQTGRPQWSNWGGLNDVLRNLSFTNGIVPTETNFGSVLGTTNFKTNASEYRPGSNFSIAGSNGSYRGRIMASHFTGVLKNDWAFAFSLSSRFAKEASREGSSYDAYSAFLSAEKILNAQHRINFTAVFAYNQRGKSSANTQEVIDLKGVEYNSYWGYQNGNQRNSRVQTVNEPFFQVNHYWEITQNTRIHTAAMFQIGSISASRLGFSNVNSPDPSYYKYLPSYQLQFENFEAAYLTEQDFKNNGQIDWYSLYASNSLTNTSGYYLYKDKVDDMQFSMRTNYHQSISKRMNIDAALGFRRLKSHNYAKVLDDLGGSSFLDIDGFEYGDAAQSDLNNRDRKIGVGDAFSYNYEIDFLEATAFFQFRYALKKMEVVSGFEYAYTTYQRNGMYKNGRYPETSFGVSNLLPFHTFSFKSNGVYKFSGRHAIYANIAFISRPPVLKNIYANIRFSSIENLTIKSEKINTIDVSYQYRSPKLKTRATLYYTLFKDASETSFFYAEGLRGNHADFVAQTVTGINKRHVGLEFGLDYEINSEFSVSGVMALGSFTYNNNPNLNVESDLFDRNESDFGSVYWEGKKIGGTPQRAYSIGLNYRNPSYWWIGLNGNVLTHHYLSISPILRTSNFYLDEDKVPFLNPATNQPVKKSDVESLLKQERFKNLFLLNAVGGKSWKFNTHYLGLFLSINNLLGVVYKTGGYEQARNANYQELSAEKQLNTPLFGPKYWYQNGSSYYVILSYRI
ncbi:TonB-dependent receptor [Flavicella marina]|uniref:TonB-dependent receptor n=1 Tax=Flavicella marina TaxID=1475951 RepID=UPI001263EC74|nr:TonB-dependent receptor [Flavicella marina]